MIKVKILLDTRNQKKDGSFPIKIYVSNNRKVFHINTGVSTLEVYWVKNAISDKSPNYRGKNMKLRELFNQVEKTVLEIEQDGRDQSINNSQLKDIIERKLFSNQEDNFLYYMDKFIQTKTKIGTKSIYADTIGKIKLFDEDCNFKTMNVDWLLKFENWIKERGCKINSVGIHMRNIRAVFNYSIDNEYTNLYPFRRFKIKSQKTAKRSLTVEDLKKLMNYPCEPHQVIYRDLFMLIFYLIGINPIDLFNLKEIKSGRIEYYRAKTGKRYSIKVEPEALEIIEKYRGKEYILDVLERYNNYKDFSHRMNLNLKQIGEVERKGLGGKKFRTPLFPDITIYHARHTWATIASKLDIPKETISAALGHSIGSDVTEIYIDFDMTKVDEANRKILDFLKKNSL